MVIICCSFRISVESWKPQFLFDFVSIFYCRCLLLRNPSRSTKLCIKSLFSNKYSAHHNSRGRNSATSLTSKHCAHGTPIFKAMVMT
jgi:hypothetical protein